MGVVFTERELDVMAVLWEHGPSTVGEVLAEITDDIAYNTVLSMLRILEEKGHVGHTEDGRAHRYFAAVGREEAGGSALDRVVDKIFGGSPELLLTNFVKDTQLTAAQLRRLRKLLDDRLKESGQ